MFDSSKRFLLEKSRKFEFADSALLPSEEKLSRCGGGQNSQKVKSRFFKSLEKSERSFMSLGIHFFDSEMESFDRIL
jgi:hypothetical protein